MDYPANAFLDELWVLFWTFVLISIQTIIETAFGITLDVVG